MCILDHMQTAFFYLGRFLKQIADDQCSSITKSNIYHMKHNVHTNFYHGSGLTWYWMFNRIIYYLSYLHILRFTLYGRYVESHFFHKFNDTFFSTQHIISTKSVKRLSSGVWWLYKLKMRLPISRKTCQLGSVVRCFTGT